MSEFFKNKSILVTGACGTVGSEIISILSNLKHSSTKVIGVDNNENAIFYFDNLFAEDQMVSFRLADIRESKDILPLMRGIDIVIHSAAYKHVMLSEVSPNQFIQTNVYGLQNMISCATEADVQVFINTSSDKAVNPTNIMGVTKLLGEKLVTTANQQFGSTVFASTRFGNVLGSAGSVFPIFLNQIKEGKPLTLTSKEMTRFVMSINQAAQLVLDSAAIANGGEIFVTKMPVISILDLAQSMIDEFSVDYGRKAEELYISEIGAKQGEKMFEELMNQEETRRTLELSKFYVIRPPFVDKEITDQYENIISQEVEIPYNSEDENKLSGTDIKNLLKDYGLLK
jgi:FlaA1/EpsC-like NDP-sugar epimerase